MRILGLALVLGLVACGGGSTSAEPADDADSSVDVLADASNETADDTSEETSVDASTCASPGDACTSAGDCCSGSCSTELGVCLAGTCGAPGTTCGLAIAALDDDRDRVLDTYAQVQGSTDRCAAWAKLDGTQKGLFLTHSDMLGNRSCMEKASVSGGKCPPGADQAFGHVFKLWAINGNDSTCSCTVTSDGYKCCNGGGEWHRIFFTADDLLIRYLREVGAGLPEWGKSNDLAGPHAPFTQSGETAGGSPRGQTHFWAKDSEATALKRTGVMGVLDPHIVELDNDYNIVHDSNPEGCYGFFGLGCTYGRALFKKSWSDKGNQQKTTFRGNGEPSTIAELASDAVYSPRCPTSKVESVSAPIERGAVVKLSGAGFESGTVVHLRTRAGEVVIAPGSPFLLSQSPTELRVQIPAESTTGEAYAWVVVDGVLSNLLPIVIAK